MAGISRLTALIILSRGNDVIAGWMGPDLYGKYFGTINLKNGDRYKILFDTGPAYENSDCAQQAVQKLINDIRKDDGEIIWGDYEKDKKDTQ